MKRTYGLTIGLGLVLMMAACGDDNANTDDTEPNENNEVTSNNENTENNNENINENNGNSLNNNENDDETEENTENNNEHNSEENQQNDDNNDTNEADADTIDDVSLFFIDDQALNLYRVPSGETVEMSAEGAEETFEMWLEGPESEELSPIAHEDTELDYVEFHDDTAHVSFTETILDSNVGASTESMLVDQIALMMEQFDMDETLILIEGEDAGDFLGHMNLSEPVEAGDPDDYNVFEE
ncbi:GerMN domain-containing protein [Salisediminibacterium halotolerans]|uniref:GerMN domain-containing protein n=1 Tax=Salisediminibacterium halotolerans TaxID=517425 RepID=UPI000EB1AEE0|nr:GerMN domain-containing protein [Salisediminibacterium halotolerans]RLJ73275.1 sporulation and spore germination protein [Actinophytocola xinjiangensis]RPE86697.1 sporulation and spore germination protein [Salisediminibacterium halotolerans]TWG34072.1 sporulation and spore germination protein [Salisediminibacterium halotolerans]GEL07587.1 hypothetical protein SHA02_10030 [Salisediminibacterium halotolerans]